MAAQWHIYNRKHCFRCHRGQTGIFESIFARLPQNKSEDIVVGARPIYRPSGSKLKHLM